MNGKWDETLKGSVTEHFKVPASFFFLSYRNFVELRTTHDSQSFDKHIGYIPNTSQLWQPEVERSCVPKFSAFVRGSQGFNKLK
jgi:hypothetical protein